MSSTAEFVLQQTAMSATPLLLAGYGELLAQRAGVINVGIEGTMLMGAIAGFGGAVLAGSAAAAIPAAMGAGILFGAIFALIVVWFRADQIVAGTAMNLLAAGVSTTAWSFLQRQATGGQQSPAFGRVAIPGLANIPLIGPALFDQYGLFYAVVLMAPGLIILLRYSRLGLIVRALGDSPDACDAAGIRVRVWRTGLLLFAGAASGLAGAYLSTMRGNTFQINMTDGRGFLVLALVIFGRWNMWGFIVGVIGFGAIDALQTYLAAAPEATARVPHQAFEMLPYVATLVALAILSRGRGGPIYLGKAWPE